MKSIISVCRRYDIGYLSFIFSRFKSSDGFAQLVSLENLENMKFGV